MPMIDKPGFYPALSHAEYHADPCPAPSLSASIAHMLVSQSPLHAHHAHPRLGNAMRDDPTAEMDFGTLLHALVLGGGGPNVVEVDAEDWRTKVAKEAREAARAAGKLPVLRRKLEPAVKLADKIMNRLAAKGIGFDGQSELTAAWQRDGVWCRARLDHWRPDCQEIIDLKFLNCADPESFARVAPRDGYDIQAAAYTEAIETLIPEAVGRVSFTFVIVESSPPWPISLIRCGGSMRELGERRWNRARGIWGQCIYSGVWRPYSDDVVSVEAPDYEIARDMDRQLAAMGGTSNEPF